MAELWRVVWLAQASRDRLTSISSLLDMREVNQQVHVHVYISNLYVCIEFYVLKDFFIPRNSLFTSYHADFFFIWTISWHLSIYHIPLIRQMKGLTSLTEARLVCYGSTVLASVVAAPAYCSVQRALLPSLSTAPFLAPGPT